MRNIHRIFIIAVIISTNIINVFAGSEQGNRGPIYLTTAWNLLKGDLTFQGNSRFYFNTKFVTTRINFWDVQGVFNLNYGIGKHHQISLSQIIYQDNHKPGKGFNLPDDMFLRVKFGSFPAKPGPIKFGVLLTTRFPFAKHHNIQFEPYSSGNIEFGVMGLMSYTKNQIYPDSAFNAHLNLGIFDHNDRKKFKEFGIEYINQNNSREIYGGLALIYPMVKFDFSVELYGNYNISKPPPIAYSRHNYLYITPGITYNAFYWLSLACGFDFRLTKNKSSASHLLLNMTTRLLPTYPTWRINFSVRVNLVSKLKGRFAQKEKFESIVTDKSKKDVYQDIANERKQIENAELELQKIREERKKMDEILNRLRKALELKDNKNKDEKGKKK